MCFRFIVASSASLSPRSPQAASSYVAGEVPSGSDPLVGRRIAVRLPFGCGGPKPAQAGPAIADGVARATWGRDRKSIQLSLTPGDWAESALIAGAGADVVWEAAVFPTGSSRVGQRNGRAYSYSIRAEGDQPLAPAADGYRLVLEGRVVGFPGGRAIRCRTASPDQRPVCIAAIQLDRVAFESATGDVLGQWR